MPLDQAASCSYRIRERLVAPRHVSAVSSTTRPNQKTFDSSARPMRVPVALGPLHAICRGRGPVVLPTVPFAKNFGRPSTPTKLSHCLGWMDASSKRCPCSNTRDGTRTRNLLLRREAPYPLGHTSSAKTSFQTPRILRTPLPDFSKLCVFPCLPRLAARETSRSFNGAAVGTLALHN